MSDEGTPSSSPGTPSSAVKYSHRFHPWGKAMIEGAVPRPKKVRDHVRKDTVMARFNARFGLGITVVVGTMWCAYIFAAIALVSLPSAITSHELTVLIAWISSNFLQLVLLPIIIVGQNLQARASDERAANTYKDAEAVLHEAIEIQKHLAAQDVVLSDLITRVRTQPA